MVRGFALIVILAGLLSFNLSLENAHSAEATPASCPTTTEAENVEIARIWHEEGTNNHITEAQRDILASKAIHHAAGGYADTTDADGVVAMMSHFPPAFSDLH